MQDVLWWHALRVQAHKALAELWEATRWPLLWIGMETALSQVWLLWHIFFHNNMTSFYIWLSLVSVALSVSCTRHLAALSLPLKDLASLEAPLRRALLGSTFRVSEPYQERAKEAEEPYLAAVRWALEHWEMQGSPCLLFGGICINYSGIQIIRRVYLAFGVYLFLIFVVSLSTIATDMIDRDTVKLIEGLPYVGPAIDIFLPTLFQTDKQALEEGFLENE